MRLQVSASIITFVSLSALGIVCIGLGYALPWTTSGISGYNFIGAIIQARLYGLLVYEMLPLLLGSIVLAANTGQLVGKTSRLIPLAIVNITAAILGLILFVISLLPLLAALIMAGVGFHIHATFADGLQLPLLGFFELSVVNSVALVVYLATGQGRQKPPSGT